METMQIKVDEDYLCNALSGLKIKVNQNPNPNPNHNEKVRMVCASFYIPKYGSPLGEDAHFICSESQTIGVADGVGNSVNFGSYSGDYARQLMSNAYLAVKGSAVDPKEVLREAYRRNSESMLKGSSTACLVSLSKGILRSANVGDSGFMIFRRNRLVYRSETQQRYFDCPCQLSNIIGYDRPEYAVEAEIPVVAGDVVVLGTDGFLDNMFPEEVEDILMRALAANDGIVDVALVATAVAHTALDNSLNKFIETPFSMAAKLTEKFSGGGGKINDITVIVGFIVDSHN